MALLPDATLMRLKAATRDLVTACGGLARAAEIAGVSDTTVSRWQLPHHGDVISLTAALALEAECRWPAVTAAMAGVNGRALAEPEAVPAGGNLMAGVAALTRDQGELMAAFGAAIADGRVTPAEADRIDQEAADVERSAARLRTDIAGLRGPRAKREGRTA